MAIGTEPGKDKGQGGEGWSGPLGPHSTPQPRLSPLMSLLFHLPNQAS